MKLFLGTTNVDKKIELNSSYLWVFTFIFCVLFSDPRRFMHFLPGQQKLATGAIKATFYQELNSMISQRLLLKKFNTVQKSTKI